MELRTIIGTNVDLIMPFPVSEINRIYGWMHCYRTLTESDDTFKERDKYCEWLAGRMAHSVSWGIIDKNHLTNNNHEAPLVGYGSFEPLLMPNNAIRDGYVHLATARRSWKARLVDEAVPLMMRDLFDGIPTLLRFSGMFNERNAPMKSLARRMGWKCEGVKEDAFTFNGEAQNLIMYGITRRNYEKIQTSLVSSVETTPISKE
jgi:RimJ/RimL family protein N-acetyltransferase